jgi:hypothetical protein
MVPPIPLVVDDDPEELVRLKLEEEPLAVDGLRTDVVEFDENVPIVLDEEPPLVAVLVLAFEELLLEELVELDDPVVTEDWEKDVEVLVEELFELNDPVAMEDWEEEERVTEENELDPPDKVESPDGPSLAVWPSISKVPLDPKEIVCPPMVCSVDPGMSVVLGRIKIVSSPVATSPEANVTVS